MSEAKTETRIKSPRLRHRGRESQVLIYLGKQLRFFINESDWKVLPMAAIIAALVGMVIRKNFFINMEGSLFGAFAIACVSIWNGCFNSIQSVCRERPIIKREHRSGMHVSSYVTAHIIYQFMLCLAQSALTMYVFRVMDVKFPEKGFMTPWMIVDIGISMLLISYAADMMSLFISSISHTTTGAMTVMPFVLIFQLVFSGGIIPLPEWSQKLSNFTISNYGLKVVAAQSGYNELPMVTGWKTLDSMRNREVGGTFTVGQVMALLDSPALEARRSTELIPAMKVSSMLTELAKGMEPEQTAFLQNAASSLGEDDITIPALTLGQVVQFAKESPLIQSRLDQSFTFKTTVGEILSVFGEDEIKAIVQGATAAASRKPEYARTVNNIVSNWLMLGAFIVFFALLATISLELIDHDKR